MSRVQADELWVMPLALILQCHHIRRREHVVVCVCVSVLAQRWWSIYMHMLWKRWDCVSLMLSLRRGLKKFPFVASACVLLCERLCCRASEKKTDVLQIIRTTMQSASEHAIRGEGSTWMKNAYESRFKWLFTHACANKMKSEYVIILMMCFGAMQFYFIFGSIASKDAGSFSHHEHVWGHLTI